MDTTTVPLKEKISQVIQVPGKTPIAVLPSSKLPTDNTAHKNPYRLKLDIGHLIPWRDTTCLLAEQWVREVDIIPKGLDQVLDLTLPGIAPIEYYPRLNEISGETCTHEYIRMCNWEPTEDQKASGLSSRPAEAKFEWESKGLVNFSALPDFFETSSYFPVANLLNGPSTSQEHVDTLLTVWWDRLIQEINKSFASPFLGTGPVLNLIALIEDEPAQIIEVEQVNGNPIHYLVVEVPYLARLNTPDEERKKIRDALEKNSNA